MACGSCGGGNRATNDYVVTIEGVTAFTGQTVAEARIWIAQNAKGRRATVRPIPRKKA
jgi:hypothetical protein